MKVDQALVRKRRLEMSWSQEMLAEMAGLNLRTIQRLESTGLASLRTRRLVAAALGLDPSALDADIADRPEDNPPSGDVAEARRVSTPGRTAPGRSMLVALYALSATLTLGFVVLDQLYSRLIGSARATVEQAVVQLAVADFLLQFTAFSALIAIGAIWAAWPNKASRRLCLASAFVGLLFPITLMAVINGVVPALWHAMDESGWGAIVRLLAHTLSAALAFWAWTAFRADVTPAATRPALPEVDRAR